jgi:flagellar basal body rod protein FlgC
MTNVNTFIELADLREASQSHEACLKGYEKALSMIQDIITSLKG